MGAACANPRCDFERLHDVQAGLGQLGPADHLAGDWAGRVLQLWSEAQPGAGDRGWEAPGSVITGSGSMALRTARRAVLFYSRGSLEKPSLVVRSWPSA